MSANAIYEENKVQECLALLKSRPDLSIAAAARQTRASYPRVRRRLQGIPASNTRGGHNQKLNTPQNEALKDHLLFCYHTRRPAGLSEVIESANTLLRYNGIYTPQGDDATVSRRWAERWLKREHKFLRTLRSKPLS
jgi:hypothetical protein